MVPVVLLVVVMRIILEAMEDGPVITETVIMGCFMTVWGLEQVVVPQAEIQMVELTTRLNRMMSMREEQLVKVVADLRQVFLELPTG